jgi:cytochrome c1
MAATVGMTFGMYGVLFLLPLTWQSTRGLSATAAGLALIPMANAQSLKPGAQMPNVSQFTGSDLRALVSYLQSLQ